MLIIERIGLAVLILALDTTSRAGSLAIVRNGELVHEMTRRRSLTHGERLPLDFQRMLRHSRRCAARYRTVRRRGRARILHRPSSRHRGDSGSRVGARPKVVPVSTLEAVAVASGARQFLRSATWIDAQRGEVFAQLHEVPGTRDAAATDAPYVRVTPKRCSTPGARTCDWRGRVPRRRRGALRGPDTHGHRF